MNEMDAVEYERADSDSSPICPCCLEIVESDEVLFCPKCGAPIDPVASMLPFEQILAEGYVWRRAGDSPRSWVVLVGIWLLMLPGVLLGLVILFGERSAWTGNLEGAGWSETVFLLIYGAVSALLVVKVTRNFLKRAGKSASDSANPA